MNRKRVVILTGEDLEHRYVANVLCEAFPIDGIVVVKAHPALPQRLRGLRPRIVLWAMVHGLYWWLVRDAPMRRSSFVRILGEDMTTRFHRGDVVRHVESVNGEPSARLLTELEPDLLLVYGTAIVADPILELAGELALNMHTGISPYYRGSDTWFWPLVNGELHMIGATVHECTSALDGGPIFETRRALLGPTRNMYDLFAWSVVAGAEIYVDVVREFLSGEAQSKPQELWLGKEYRWAERTPRANHAARRLIRSGVVDEYVRAGGPDAGIAG